jgi:hypothetical protein
MYRLNDSVVQSRVDKRYLATAVKFFMAAGRFPRNRSDLIRQIVEEFIGILVTNKRVEFITESGEARALLSNIFGDDGLNVDERGRRNEYNNLNLDIIERNPEVIKDSESLSKLKEYQDRKIEIQRERANENKKLREKAIEDARSSGAIVDDPRTPYDHKSMRAKPLTREEIEQKENQVLEQDKERQMLENAPLDPEFIKKNIVRP